MSPKEWMEKLIVSNEDNGFWGIKAIVPKRLVKGDRLETVTDADVVFDHHYVDQDPGGGMTGDEFSGRMYFPLDDSEEFYLETEYNC